MVLGARWKPWFVLFVLCLATQILASDSDHNDAHTAMTPEEPVDVCEPLYHAQGILRELSPSPNAHIEKKIAGGPIGPFGSSRGWGDGLGWGHEGPLSTAFRMLPRLLNTLLSPSTILNHLRNLPLPLPSFMISSTKPTDGKSKPRRKVSSSRKAKIRDMLQYFDEAEQGGCQEVHKVKGQLRMFPPKGVRQDLPAAFQSYKTYLRSFADPEAQFIVAMFYSTGLGGVREDQGKALLYYTFAALQGYKPAEMALGYRYWAGIGAKEDCSTALDYYEGAAEKAYAHFLSGPPGGRTLPLSTSRLSDLVGGIYGPHASWASTGANAFRPAVQAVSASARGETEAEILEYYQYHADRDSYVYTARLGRLFYHGSVYPSIKPGISAGAEGAGEIPQSFQRARDYFTKAARVIWPKDVDSEGRVAGRRKLSKEVEDALKDPSMMAATYLGRMAFRGEGQKQDFAKARLWYERASELGDREAHNGLGIMFRDGLGVKADKLKAYQYFQAAAEQDLPEAQVNLAKLHLERGEIKVATQYLEAALRYGSPFEAFHLLATIYATTARLPAHAGGRSGMCGVSVAYYKLVAERGRWPSAHNTDFLGEANKAWLREDEENNAILGWIIAGEMGIESGMNNVAFLLDKGYGADLWEGGNLKERAMRWWIRSAAQDNVDAMVKVGDLYYSGLSPNVSHQQGMTSHELAASYYQAAADTQSSSMAYWNLGYMYEMGLGVPRDWHLAKRYYDRSGETSLEAWPAVLLSTLGLYLRSWWVEIRSGGEIPGLRLFPDNPDDDAPVESAGLWDRLSRIFAMPGLEGFDDYDPDQRDTYDDYSGSGWGGELAEEDWEDMGETVLICGLIFGVMALTWIRGVWQRREAERVRAEQDRLRRDGIAPAVQEPFDFQADLGQGADPWDRLEPPVH